MVICKLTAVGVWQRDRDGEEKENNYSVLVAQSKI
jgi:hypothetical protein